MIFFPWTLECSVGVAAIDNEHWQLMKLINELYDSMLRGAAAEHANDIIDGVQAYADLHLKHEEDAMVWAGYPAATAHREQHDAFRQRVQEFHRQAEDARGTLAMIDIARELSVFLKAWLENHIMHDDHRLGQFLNAKGVR